MQISACEQATDQIMGISNSVEKLLQLTNDIMQQANQLVQ
jgi:hypothetical protein